MGSEQQQNKIAIKENIDQLPTAILEIFAPVLTSPKLRITNYELVKAYVSHSPRARSSNAGCDSTMER